MNNLVKIHYFLSLHSFVRKWRNHTKILDNSYPLNKKSELKLSLRKSMCLFTIEIMELIFNSWKSSLPNIKIQIGKNKVYLKN